ncbi:MAG TPA: ketoacyl-ACP synthase III [Bryobacteraceae bacterium]|nr:ketoacyl-ACP synthase III [Bryobacteraceae bacterium]
MPAFLHCFGAYVPERIVTNQEIGARVGKEPAWIESVSGIRERRWAAPEISVADLAVAAARDCLRNASVEASTLGMIVVASGSGARGFPGPAATVAAHLGLEGTPALDVPMASAGSLFGLVLASRMVEAYGDVLVIGAEKMSAAIETHAEGASNNVPLDPSTAILFGDGAGAALVSSRPPQLDANKRCWEILDAVLHTDGQFRDDLAWDGSSALRMNGLSVIMQAARKIPAAISEVLARQNVAATDVQAFLLHQANQNLLVRVAKTLGVPPERVVSNVARYGNTSSASMLIAAAEWARENPPAGNVVFAAFGAGFHWGALLARSC